MDNAAPHSRWWQQRLDRRAGSRPRAYKAAATALFLLLLSACGRADDGGPERKPASDTPVHAPVTTPAPALSPASGDGTDDWWRVPDRLHIPSVDDSTTYNGRYKAEYVQVNTTDPTRDVKNVDDATPLKERLEIGPGLGKGCTRRDYVVTCPATAERQSGPPFWLRARPGAPRGEAGRINLSVHRKEGPPLTRSTRVLIGSPLFLKRPVRRSPDRVPGSSFDLNPEFVYRGDLPVTGVTVQLEIKGADFRDRHGNCRYETLPAEIVPPVTLAECDFPATTVTDGEVYRLPEPLAAVVSTTAKKSDGLPADSGSLTYSVWPTGAPDERIGLRPDAPRGKGPALRLEKAPSGPGGTEPSELTETYRGGLEFVNTLGKEVAAAEIDLEAPPIVVKGRIGEEISLAVPAAIAHQGGYTTTRNRELLVTLPEGVTPLPQRGEDLPSEAGFCGDAGPQKVRCYLDTYGNPDSLHARIDRLVPGATGRVELTGEDHRTGKSQKIDDNPANDHAVTTVEITDGGAS
ncbi:hypothetical protein [Streptomyces sp. NPDC058657]|uniref:hypothetical protein n=1 Tax=unclassified Streptomyces TaxID=2593676 RepID=UPI00365A76A5